MNIDKEKNLAGWQPLPNKFYEVSAAMIQRHLENDILGFKIACDWERWTGVDVFNGYLRMRCVMSPSDIELPNDNQHTGYAYDELRNMNANSRNINQEVIKTLEPFMYPTDLQQWLRNQNESTISHMHALGICGDKLQELINFSRLTLITNESNGKEYYRVYLRPERILMNGLNKTDGDNGKVFIRRIYGTSEANFYMLAERVLNNTAITDDISVDQIFALR